MKNEEFNTEFDVLFNNITSNQAPGLNVYEKSVFLTKAQQQLVTEYFNNRVDSFGGGFDGSQKRQYDFSEISRVEKLFDVNTFKERINSEEKLDRRSKVFLFPQNYFLTVNEILSDESQQYSVIPINYMEYQRLMMKPYNLPVKRAAWRMITDKKNCNFCHEGYEIDGDTDNYKVLEDNDSTAQSDYKILSSWADQKRNIQLCIRCYPWPDNIDKPAKDSVYGSFSVGPAYIWKNSSNGEIATLKVAAATKWLHNNKTYGICIDINSMSELGYTEALEDDESVIKFLQDYSKDMYKELALEDDVYKAISHMDGFMQCSAPSKMLTFLKESGRTFTTHVIDVPMAEIIGKFSGDIQYQLRYIRTLTPIILEDLSDYGTDITIGGYSKMLECSLPEETHPEILERAVTLAKIAWQGGTVTQAAAQSKDN